MTNFDGEKRPRAVESNKPVVEKNGAAARRTIMQKREFLRLPVVSASAEFLVMGYLMRRNILAYKAPPNNEGYDLICIHPDPRHNPQGDEAAQVRVQVKSRYATDCDRGFPVKEVSLDAFDFLIVA